MIEKVNWMRMTGRRLAILTRMCGNKIYNQMQINYLFILSIYKQVLIEKGIFIISKLNLDINARKGNLNADDKTTAGSLSL